ncbi:MAG: dihydrofolate reductase [Candidatus Marisimplicoccus sp.]
MEKKELTIIAAVSLNNVIGNKNKLIWNIPNDLKRFKDLTTGHSVIMGQKDI